MSNKERLLISSILAIVAIISGVDLATDLSEGVTWWHVSIEASVILVAAFGIFATLKGHLLLKGEFAKVEQENSKLALENRHWKEKSKTFVLGLSQSIDEQLNLWELSKSEKEITFLLLKGFSNKEIADLRGTTEKTVRSQCSAIYSKSGLSTRSQLAAYFLEDLLLPPE